MKIYLIPNLLGDNGSKDNSITKEAQEIINSLNVFFVENEKTARRHLRRIGFEGPIDKVVLFPIGKHSNESEFSRYFQKLGSNNAGILSEAGMPGIADPGSLIVKMAHQKKIDVVPLVGPSSILLALIASGFNGQNFTFHGYLPLEKKDKIRKIKYLESLASKGTQLFMETPFRNNQLMEILFQACSPATQLSIACDISLESEFIKTLTLKEWKQNKPELNKRPCIFSLGV